MNFGVKSIKKCQLEFNFYLFHKIFENSKRHLNNLTSCHTSKLWQLRSSWRYYRKQTYFLSIVQVVSCLPLCINKLLRVMNPWRDKPSFRIPSELFFWTTVWIKPISFCFVWNLTITFFNCLFFQFSISLWLRKGL